MRTILTIFVIVLLIVIWIGLKEENFDGFPEIQDSNCDWTVNEGNFVRGMCEKYGIDASNDYYKLSCPKCPYNGAFIERLPDGATLYKFLFPTDGQSYCAECGYPIGHDWKIYKIDPNCNSYVVFEKVGSVELKVIERE